MNNKLKTLPSKLFTLHDTFIPAELSFQYSSPAKGKIEKSGACSYVLSGRLQAKSENRSNATVYSPSNRRMAAGAIMPGDYWLTALDDVRMRCFRITKHEDRNMYDVKEVILKPGDEIVIDPSAGIEAFALIIGEVTIKETEETIEENTLKEVTGVTTIFANAESTIAYGVKIA